MKTLLLSLLLLGGCCHYAEKPPVVRLDTMYVPVGGITDTAFFAVHDTATIETKHFIVRTDTIMKRIYVTSKKDTLLVPYHDTVNVYLSPAPTRGILDGITLRDVMVAGAIIVFIVLPLLYYFRKA